MLVYANLMANLTKEFSSTLQLVDTRLCHFWYMLVYANSGSCSFMTFLVDARL